MEALQRTYSCVVIDDDAYAVDYLQSLITAHPSLTFLKGSSEPLSILADWNKQRPSDVDFLFLDVQMPGISGLDFARLTRQYYQHLIITTSHTRYAIASYDVYSSHFLLKPFNQQKFITTIENLIYRTVYHQKKNDSIFLKSGRENTFVQVQLVDIILVSALEHYCIIHTINNKYIQHITLQQIEKLLSSDDRFLRINRSFMVSMKHIVSICGSQLIMSNGEKISVGPTFRNNVMSRLNLF